MKNIEFKATDKYGKTYSEKLNGRKLTRFVAKEAAKRNINEHKVIRDFVDYHFDKYYSDKEITSFEFTWLNQFNSSCKIVQQGLEIVMRNNKKEIFKRVQRLSDNKYNYKDANGKTLFNEWYEWVSHFYEGFALIEIEREGDYFKDGFADVERTNGEQAKIDKTGKIIVSK